MNNSLLPIIEARLADGSASLAEALSYPALAFLNEFSNADLNDDGIIAFGNLAFALVPSLLASLDLVSDDVEKIEPATSYIVAAMVGLYVTVAKAPLARRQALAAKIDQAVAVLREVASDAHIDEARKQAFADLILHHSTATTPKYRVDDLKPNPIIDAWLAKYSSDTKQ